MPAVQVLRVAVGEEEMRGAASGQPTGVSEAHREKLNQYVVSESGCWEWSPGKFSGGYGRVNIGGKERRAHRAMWELVNGKDIPAGMVIAHKCDNPCCVNPEHLQLATQKWNSLDCANKGRLHVGVSKNSAKLDDQKIVEIFSLRKSGMTQREIGEVYGVHHTTILDVLLSKSWRHVNVHGRR